MSELHADFLLIGGGVASANCAEALREQGAEGSIVILSRELDAPYHRPPGTKEFLRGEQEHDDALVHEASWYEENDIDLRLRSSVRSIDPQEKTVKVQGGDVWSYGKALLATGSLVQRLRIDGDDLDGLHYIRTLRTAEEVREDAASAQEAVVIGGSFIGSEVAASLTEMGKKVTLILQEDEPMATTFGTSVGAHLRNVLEEHGVTVLGGHTVERFEGEGRVAKVITDQGEEIPAEVVVLGTGARPDVMIAKAAGLELGESGGVKCDTQLRTSALDLWAAGDICEYDSKIHGRRLRVEHEAVAEAQGSFVAAAMLGSQDAYAEVPMFWSDVSDWFGPEYVGPADDWDEEVVRGSFESGEFSVLYVKDGKLAALLSVGRDDDLDAATTIIAAGGDLRAAPAELADPDQPLLAQDA